MKRLMFKISFFGIIPALVFVCSCERLESNRPPLAPNDPFPEDGASVSGESVQLSWQCSDPDGDVISYNVHFGDSVSLGTNILATALVDTTIAVEQLEPGQTYFWSIVAIDDHNHVTGGPVWSFSVEGASTPQWNPYPADLSSDLSMETSFVWESDFDSAEAVSYDFYCGPTSDPPLIAEGLTSSSYDPGWKLQFDAIRTLKYIYQGQLQYYAENGHFWGQGILVDAGNQEYLSTIGVVINQSNIYGFTFTSANETHLLVTATTILFDLVDADPDSWTINDLGEIACTSNDADLAFVQQENYYWKVVAHDGSGRMYESPVWNFSSADYVPDDLASIAPGVPYNPLPEDQEVDFSSMSLQWSCNNLQSGFVAYDLYLGQDPDPPLYASEIYSKSYFVGHLQTGQVYYWRVVARNNHGDAVGSLVWQFQVTDNYPPDFVSASFTHPPEINYDDTALLSWAFSDAENDDLAYDLYLGINPDPPLLMSGLGDTCHDLEWSRQMNLRTVLLNIYAQQLFYWGAQGSFWGDGLSASGVNPENFSELGVSISTEDPYEYTIQIANDTSFEIMATADFDSDGDLDIWKIDKNCYIQCVSHDSNLPIYQKAQNIYWKIVVIDSHGNRTESPINSFSTWSNRAPSVMATAYPAPQQEEIPVELSLKWFCHDLDGDSIVYDIYFDTTYYPPRIADGVSDICLALPPLLNNQYYYWTVVPRNPGQPRPQLTWPDYFWTEP